MLILLICLLLNLVLLVSVLSMLFGWILFLCLLRICSVFIGGSSMLLFVGFSLVRGCYLILCFCVCLIVLMWFILFMFVRFSV